MGAKGVRVKNRPFAEGYKKTGLDGLKPYLTSEGRKKFDTLTMFTDGMGMFGGMGGPGMEGGPMGGEDMEVVAGQVVTIGGIYGTVEEIAEHHVMMRVDTNVHIRVAKSSIVKDFSDVQQQ